MGEWIALNWIELAQAVSIAVGIVFAVVNLRQSRREQHIANSIAITQANRDLWNKLLDSPSLERVMDPAADVVSEPVTYQEIIFTRSVALHYNALLDMVASRRLTVRPGLQAEVAAFFALPVPASAWKLVRTSQSPQVVRFVEGPPPSTPAYGRGPSGQ